MLKEVIVQAGQGIHLTERLPPVLLRVHLHVFVPHDEASHSERNLSLLVSVSRSCLIPTTSPRLCRLYICTNKAPAGETEQMSRGWVSTSPQGNRQMFPRAGWGAGNTNSAKKSSLTPLVACYLAHTLLISFSSAVSYLKKGTGISGTQDKRIKTWPDTDTPADQAAASAHTAPRLKLEPAALVCLTTTLCDHLAGFGVRRVSSEDGTSRTLVITFCGNQTFLCSTGSGPAV